MKMVWFKGVLAILAITGGLFSMPAQAGKTLDGIRSRGQMVCGVHTGLVGFSALSRDASMGLLLTAVTYYDGQGFIVPARSSVRDTRQLKGQMVCVQSGTTSERNLSDYSKAHGLGIEPVLLFEKEDAATAAYFAGRCSAYTSDASGLASIRSRQTSKQIGRAHV